MKKFDNWQIGKNNELYKEISGFDNNLIISKYNKPIKIIENLSGSSDFKIMYHNKEEYYFYCDNQKLGYCGLTIIPKNDSYSYDNIFIQNTEEINEFIKDEFFNRSIPNRIKILINLSIVKK